MPEPGLDELSCEPCIACGHPRAFHRPSAGACFAEPNRNKASRSEVEDIEQRKKFGIECWCWRYETDLATGIDSVLKHGDRAALVATADAALERADDYNAERVLDCYVRKTAQGERDPAWIAATERSIARFQSQSPGGRVINPEPVSGDNTASPPQNSDFHVTEPTQPTFRWEDLDHRLIDLKLSKLAEQMQAAITDDERLVQAETIKKGNSAYFLPAFFEKQEQRTREWARNVYETYCEVWQLQGGTMTLAFVKAVYERAVVPLIAARKGSAESQVMLRATRTGSTHNPQLAAAVGQWHRQIQNLRVSLWREFEIETSEWKYKLATQQAGASKLPENFENRGLPPDGSPKKTVHLTKAPPPPSEVGGRGVIHGPKPTEIPRDLPVNYPRALVARTFVIIGEAVKKFPVQTQTLELCRYVISELTPHFREALQAKAFQQDQALSTMHDLLHDLVVHNCGDGKRSEVEQEVRKSDEWLTLAREIAREIDNATRGAAESGGMKAATWDTIEISFTSEERVQIRNGVMTETRNYADFGFADGRSRKPNRAWQALYVLAAKRGIIRDPAKTGEKWPGVEKRMQEIRKILRKQFGISADPIPFVEGTGYQARFKIGCGPSFHT
jgi:hypothetical protein